MITDLSKWQGDIDFGKLKSQVEFVILRVQAGYTNVDAEYKEYVAGCKANGIPFGTYAYFKGVSVPDSIAEAKNAFELMNPESKFFALDIEEVSCRDLVTTGQAFIDYLKSKGVQKVGLYSGESFFNAHNLVNIKCDFRWIAKYGTNDGQQHTKPSIPCDLWQYTSVGHLEGISGDVDLNVLTGSKPLEYFTDGAPVQTIPQPLQRVGRIRILATDLHIRTGPGTNYSVVGKAVTGHEYDVYDYKDDWYKIAENQWVFGNGEAYVYLTWRNDGRPLQPDPQKPAAPQPVYYVIRSGDNLTKIANNNGTTISQLQSWNGIKDPNKIYAGQKIRVK